jgi:RHS repeat-associated protein
VSTYGYDQADRLTSWTHDPEGDAQGPATVTYGWDKASNRTSAGNATAQFDARNRLTTDGTTTFSRGPSDELLALDAGADERLIVSDQHGDVIAGFDPALDSVADSTAYDPFGKVTGTTGDERPIGYQGDYTDPDTDQVNMTARWYDPGSGTFTSRDDTSLPTNPSSFANRYGYGAAAPTNYADSTGNIPHGPNPCAPVPGTPKPAICYTDPGGSAGGGSGPGAAAPAAQAAAAACHPKPRPPTAVPGCWHSGHAVVAATAAVG